MIHEHAPVLLCRLRSKSQKPDTPVLETGPSGFLEVVEDSGDHHTYAVMDGENQQGGKQRTYFAKNN